MRKAALVTLVLLVGVTIGAAAPEVAKKFPWASDELNAEKTVTELEWRCAQFSTPDLDRIASISKRISASHIELVPTGENVELRLHLSAANREEVANAQWIMDRSAQAFDKDAESMRLEVAQHTKLPVANVAVSIYHKGKPVKTSPAPAEALRLKTQTAK